MKFTDLLLEVIDEDVETDEHFRQKAEDFYGNLENLVEEEMGEIIENIKEGEMRYLIPPGLPSDDPIFDNLAVFLVKWTKQGKMAERGSNSVLQLPMLYDTEDGEFLLRQLSTRRDLVIHEVIHYLDDRVRDIGDFHTTKLSKGDKKAYFNHPAEFNAYYQEGISSIDKRLSFMDYNLKEDFEDFSEFKDWAVKQFNDNFMHFINNRNYKRLMKRLYKWYKNKLEK